MAENLGNWQKELDQICGIVCQNNNLTQFGSLSDNNKRIYYIMCNGYIEDVSWVMLYLANCQQLHRKSAEKSEFYRNTGNELFQHKLFEDALEKYTQAILFSPMENDLSKQLALGYGNRSAVFFHLDDFQECVKDIDLALKCDFKFPISRELKLYLRRAHCYIKLREKEKAKNDLLSARQLLENYLELCQRKKDVMYKEIESLETKLRQGSSNVSQVTSEEHESAPKPSYGANDVLVQASSAVQMEYSSERGRCIVASRSLCAGDILFVEKPFASVLLPDYYTDQCHHCFRLLKAAHPCHQCCTVRFCSDQCRKEAWNLYHRVECPYLDLLHSVGIAHLGLRIILVAGLQQLLDFRSGLEANNSKESSMGLTEDGRYEGSYTAVYHLMCHSENIEVKNLFQYSLTAGLLLKILQHSGWLKSLEESDMHDVKNETSADTSMMQNSTSCVRNKTWERLNKHTANNKEMQQSVENLSISESQCGRKMCEEEIYIGGLLLRHMQQIVCNAHAITKIKLSKEADNALVDVQSQVIVATAIYPTASLMNHSCDPTIISSFHKNTLIVRTLKEVSSGEEIFHCYGPHHSRMKRHERLQALKEQYFFNCACQFCRQDDDKSISSAFRCPGCESAVTLSEVLLCKLCDYKTDGLVEREKAALAQQLFVEGLTVLQTGNVEVAVKKFLKCYKLRKVILYKHNSELSATQDCLARCYAMLGQYEKSARFLRQSIETVAVTYGDRSVELANELHKFAEVLLNAGELGEASSVTENAIEILTVLYGASHSSVIELLQFKLHLLQIVKPS